MEWSLPSIVCMADQIRRSDTASDELVDTISFYDDSEPAWDERPYFSVTEARTMRCKAEEPTLRLRSRMSDLILWRLRRSKSIQVVKGRPFGNPTAGTREKGAAVFKPSGIIGSFFPALAETNSWEAFLRLSRNSPIHLISANFACSTDRANYRSGVLRIEPSSSSNCSAPFCSRSGFTAHL